MRRRAWLLGGGFTAFLGVGTLYALGYLGPYPRGKNIREFGLDPAVERPDVRFAWSASVREPFALYCRRKGRNMAHFTGSMVLNRPNESVDTTELMTIDGKGAYAYLAISEDEALKDDAAVLRRHHLGKMIEATKNDWRILNDSNHFVDPEGPFTGTIYIRADAMFGTAFELDVKDDRIVASRRRFAIGD